MIMCDVCNERFETKSKEYYIKCPNCGQMIFGNLLFGGKK